MRTKRFTYGYERKNRIENGVKICAYCDKEPLGKGRIKYCSEKCSIDASVAGGINIRYYVRQRDNGICAVCGKKGQWEADHINPVEHGHGSCGLDNYQTLCRDCHKEKTAKQARERALKKRNSGNLFNA